MEGGKNICFWFVFVNIYDNPVFIKDRDSFDVVVVTSFYIYFAKRVTCSFSEII